MHPRVAVRKSEAGLHGSFVGRSGFVRIQGSQARHQVWPNQAPIRAHLRSEPLPSALADALAPPDPSRPHSTQKLWDFDAYLGIRDRRAGIRDRRAPPGPASVTARRWPWSGGARWPSADQGMPPQGSTPHHRPAVDGPGLPGSGSLCIDLHSPRRQSSAAGQARRPLGVGSDRLLPAHHPVPVMQGGFDRIPWLRSDDGHGRSHIAESLHRWLTPGIGHSPTNRSSPIRR